MDVLVVTWHLGALHPVEALAVGLLALGPFVILAVVVAVVSRRDRRVEAREAAEAHATRDRSAGWEAATSTPNETAAPQSVQE